MIATGAATGITAEQIAHVALLVGQIAESEGMRGYAALVADATTLFNRFLLHEARRAERGVRLVRVFRVPSDAETWLEIVSAARHF